ncbi:hypothetical protein ACLOAS_18755 (plasmid) [Bacillus sp. PVC-6B]|uniref:hypothetical protein n=1 Tax=Bacillus TaxID=1386 RepID=UPI001BE9E8F7|nr:hypothetical protein [Bacillus inaquosorum]MBT3123360.1 hypothetical protein [Bacillus inaquosorum]
MNETSFKGVLSSDIKNLLDRTFPHLLVENNTQINWEEGGQYELSLYHGQLLPFILTSAFALIDVVRIEDGQKKKLGRVKYGVILEDNDPIHRRLLGLPKDLAEESGELHRLWEMQIRDRIDRFGYGELVSGCIFVSQGSKPIPTKDEVLKRFEDRLVEEVDGFFVALMGKETFHPGQYLVQYSTIEAGFEKSWKVLVAVDVISRRMKSKKKIEIMIDTGLGENVIEPSLEEYRTVAKKVLINFEKSTRSVKLGKVEFSFKGRPSAPHYLEKIRGDKEDTEKLFGRIKKIFEMDENKKHIRGRELIAPGVLKVTLTPNIPLFLGAYGIAAGDGEVLYRKGEQSLQEGLVGLGKYAGTKKILLDIMRCYDYRKGVN